jgi:hypothetical protein
MRKTAVLTMWVVLLCLGAAQAQNSLIDNPDQAVEQMLFFRLVQQANLDAGSMAEVFDGYTRYHAAMDPLMASREKMGNEIKEAVAANRGGYELKEKLNALMSLDEKIMTANQLAIREAGTLVNPLVQAQLYLLIYNRDSMIAEARASLAGPCECATPAPATAPAAAVPAAVKEASPEEVIMQGVKGFADKLVAQDVTAATAMVSDKFANMEYGDKAGLVDFLQNAADAGYLTDLEVTVDDAEVKVAGDKATVSPVVVTGSFGEVTLTMELTKADGAWKLTGLEAEGL